MSSFKRRLLLVTVLILGFAGLCLRDVGAQQDGKKKAEAQQKTSTDAQRIQAERRRLARQQEWEIWQKAVRSYPNGIPAEARGQALEMVREMERMSARVELAPNAPRLKAKASPAVIEGTTWFPIGPAPVVGGQTYGGGRVDVSGRSTAIAVNPTNSNDVWLGTAAGGVWHSTNGGMNWLPMSDREESLAIGAIALAGCSASGCGTIYAGTGENAIRRDTYYGVGLLIGGFSGGEINIFSWTLRRGATSANPNADLFKLGSINNVTLDTTTSGASQRIYVTLSSGETASASESTVTAPTPPQGYGIFKSDDNGATWSKLSVPGTSANDKPTDLEKDPQNQNILYAGFLGKGVFKTTDGGATWCPLNPGITLPAGCAAATGLPNPTSVTFDHVELAIQHPSAASPAVLYAAFGRCPDQVIDNCKPDIFKSTDGGSSWMQTFTGTTVGNIFDFSCPRSYTRYTHALAIHPSDPNTILYGGLQVCKSTDSGANFTPLGTSSVHPDHHALVFPDLANPDRIYDSSDGGFASTLNGGTAWTSGNSDLQTMGFQSIASSPLSGRIIGGTQDNGTNMWKGARGWLHIDDGDGGPTIMDFDDVLKLYATDTRGAGGGLDGTPVRSINGGSGFSSITTGINTTEPATFYPAFVQDPLAPHPLYFGTNRLYRSTDDGDHWTVVSPLLAGASPVFPDINRTNVITAIGVRGTHVYVGYYDGKLFATNGACPSPACWSQSSGLPTAVVTHIAVDPNNSDVAYATFSGFSIGAHVFKTTNGGGSWTAISSGLPDIPTNTISVEPSAPSNLWLGTDVGVFKSTNGGGSWSPFNNGLPNSPVYEISIDETHGRAYAGTHGRGIFVITQPFLSNFEGWVDDQIWDIPVFGNGFLPNQSCTMKIVQQNGNICAMGSVDGVGGTVKTDDTGQLVTSKGSVYNNLPVAFACFNGKCVNNVNISACNSSSNPVTSVLVECGGLLGVDAITGCPAQANPPTGTFNLSGLPGPGPVASNPNAFAAADAGSFDIIPTVQGRVGTRVLCSATVTFEKGDMEEDVLESASDALNSNPACIANTLSATVFNKMPEGPGEDAEGSPPKLGLSAPGVSGGELIPALHAAPGRATGLCFNAGNLGVAVLNGLTIMKAKFETASGGAAGGNLVITERTQLGTCEITVPTAAGASATSIATAVASAFQAPGIPGPNPGCPSQNNPRDVILDGDSIITVLPSDVQICVRDAGLGVFIGPEEVVNQISDLQIVGSVSPNSVVTGSNLTYNFTVMNRGPNAAVNVVVRDNLPASLTFVSCAATGGGVCGGAGNNRTVSFASLAPNASATVTIIATASCSLAEGATIKNTATINADGIDSDLSNNTTDLTAQASNPPPVIVCPANVTAITPQQGDTSAIVNYAQPTATDNCPGVSIVCSKPSGTVFPAGVTTVTCTATDAGGATASCSFTVTVFDVCLQDDQSGDFLLFNSFTGDYQFKRCGTSGFTLTGRAKVTRTHCLIKLENAQVTATLDRCIIAPENSGSATIKPNPIGGWFFITDRNTANNTCSCH